MEGYEVEKKFVDPTEILNLDHPASNLVTMLTELSPLAKFAFRNFKLRKFK
jgi:hypothetical protein